MEAKNSSKRAERRQGAKAKPKAREGMDQGQQPGKSVERQTLVIIAIVIIFIAVFSSLFYGLVSYRPTDFKTFANNFNRAGSVAIYVNYTNSTKFAPEMSCSNALIEELTGSAHAHKNASQISFYVLYNESCTYRKGSLGTLISNYTNATRAECVGYGANKPSIFINYSSANSTVITPNRLYFTGDAKFLEECGIAYQIT